MAENLLTRDDTFFGVCEGLGEDLHIPANLLRIGMALFLLASPKLAVLTYIGLGLVVFATRLMFPPRVRRRTVRTVAAAPVTNSNEALPELAEAA